MRHSYVTRAVTWVTPALIRMTTEVAPGAGCAVAESEESEGESDRDRLGLAPGLEGSAAQRVVRQDSPLAGPPHDGYGPW